MRQKEEIYEDFLKMLNEHPEEKILIALRVMVGVFLDIRDELAKLNRLVDKIDRKGKL